MITSQNEQTLAGMWGGGGEGGGAPKQTRTNKAGG